MLDHSFSEFTLTRDAHNISKYLRLASTCHKPFPIVGVVVPKRPVGTAFGGTIGQVGKEHAGAFFFFQSIYRKNKNSFPMVSGSCLCKPSLVPAFIVALSKRGVVEVMLEPMLCDRGTPGIPACVSEELLLAAEPLDMDIPPTLVLLPQASRELGSSQVGIQDARAIRCSQVRDHGIAPHWHQCLAVERRPFPPAGAVVLEAALGDENVQVTIEVEVAAEGMRDDHDHQPHAVFPAGPLLQHLRAEHRQVVQKMPVPPEDWPEHVRHREADMGIGDVGKFPPLVPLPECRGPISATGTGAGLACVVDHPCLICRGEHLGAQNRGPAVQDLTERLPNRRPGLGTIPMVPSEFQYALKRWHGRARHPHFSAAGFGKSRVSR